MVVDTGAVEDEVEEDSEVDNAAREMVKLSQPKAYTLDEKEAHQIHHCPFRS